MPLRWALTLSVIIRINIENTMVLKPDLLRI
jgi:hypothetical protein